MKGRKEVKLTDFSESEYESSEITGEITLTADALALIQESIRMQFEDPSSYSSTDAVETFIVRYNATLQEIAEDYDEDENVKARDIHRQFILFMENIFKEKLKVGIPELEDLSEDEQLTMVHYLYRFFIINAKQNMLNFVKSYIIKHKETLGTILPDKVTASSKRYSDLMTDTDMVRICSNLSDVVQLALTDKDITVTDFLEMCRSKEDDLEREFLNDQYDNAGVTGNFVNKYRKMLPDWCIIELESSLLTTLVAKYRVETN